MHLIQIYVVCPEAAEACFDRFKNMLARQADVVGLRAHLHSALGCKDEIIALALEPLADYFFGLPCLLQGNGDRVNIRGVNEGHPFFRRDVHNAKRGFLVGLLSECHCSKAYLAYFKSSPS